MIEQEILLFAYYVGSAKAEVGEVISDQFALCGLVADSFYFIQL
jgi:hypothetical protein